MSAPTVETLEAALAAVKHARDWERTLGHENARLADALAALAREPERARFVGTIKPRECKPREWLLHSDAELLHEALTGGIAVVTVDPMHMTPLRLAAAAHALDVVGGGEHFLRIEHREGGWNPEIGYVWLWPDGSFRAGWLHGVPLILPQTFVRSSGAEDAARRLVDFLGALVEEREARAELERRRAAKAGGAR